MPELPSLMVAHLLVPEIDAELPTSLSPALVQGFLRDQLGYEGIVFTDDLCMGAIAKRYTPAESVSLALRAGCDLPLVCHDAAEHLPAVATAVEKLPQDVLEPVVERIERFRRFITTQPSMTFLEWNDYLADVRAFCASVPEVGAAPGSPVQHY